jgi:hypothetical protein
VRNPAHLAQRDREKPQTVQISHPFVLVRKKSLTNTSEHNEHISLRQFDHRPKARKKTRFPQALWIDHGARSRMQQQQHLFQPSTPRTMSTQSDQNKHPVSPPGLGMEQVQEQFRKERAENPKYKEMPLVAFDVAKSYFAQATPNSSEIGPAMLEAIRTNIDSGAIADTAQLDAFIKASKTRFPRDWAFRAGSAAQQKDLAKYLRNDDDGLKPEIWLLYKIRQRLFEYDAFKNSPMGVLQLYFEKIENGVIQNPAIDKTLAGVLLDEFYKPGCSFKTIGDLEALIMNEHLSKLPDDVCDISNIKINCRNSVLWKPSSGDEAALLTQFMGKDFMDLNTQANPGCWLKLKLRQSFGEFAAKT